jgi:hypothetical protein
MAPKTIENAKNGLENGHPPDRVAERGIDQANSG